MKNKAQTVFVAVFVLGALICLIVYMYVYQSFNKKTEALKASNTTLEARVNELSVFYGQMANNKKQIESMTKDIKEKLDEFPADVKEEDAIYMALRTWDERILVGYQNITIGDKGVLSTIPVDVVQAGGVEGLENEIGFVQRKVTYNNIASYSVMKELITSINNNPEKITISNVAYAAQEKDTEEEGVILEGTVDVTFYAVTGTGKEYVPREFEDFPVGIKNLFDGSEKRE